MSKHDEPKAHVPAKIDANKPEPYGKSFTEGVVDTSVTAGMVAGAIAIAHAVTKGGLDPATTFLASVLGTGVAKILTNGTMRLYDKITEPHENADHKVVFAGSKQVKGLPQAEQPKQLAAPVVQHGADQKLLPGAPEEGTKALAAKMEQPAKVHVAARSHHKHHSPKHKH